MTLFKIYPRLSYKICLNQTIFVCPNYAMLLHSDFVQQYSAVLNTLTLRIIYFVWKAGCCMQMLPHVNQYGTAYNSSMSTRLKVTHGISTSLQYSFYQLVVSCIRTEDSILYGQVSHSLKILLELQPEVEWGTHGSGKGWAVHRI